MSLVGECISQASFASTPSNTHTSLKENAEAALLKGDTVEACAIFRRLKIEIDSIAKINYQNEVKIKREAYQIDELYLENKLQKGIILRRISLSLFVIILLLITVFYFLRKGNRKLQLARQNAQLLKEDAELSLQKKSKLLYTISNDMTESLNQMKEITNSLQTDGTDSFPKVHDKLSNLRVSAERLQRIYHQIFS